MVDGVVVGFYAASDRHPVRFSVRLGALDQDKFLAVEEDGAGAAPYDVGRSVGSFWSRYGKHRVGVPPGGDRISSPTDSVVVVFPILGDARRTGVPIG